MASRGDPMIKGQKHGPRINGLHPILVIHQNPRKASSRSRIFLFSLVNVSVGCTGPPGYTKNNTDLKFGTNTPLDHI